MKKVLHLASWYPNRNGEQDGDFVQRHLFAMAEDAPVHVVALFRDNSLPAGTFEYFRTTRGALHETIGYYNSYSTGIRPLDALLSTMLYRRYFLQMVRMYFHEHGKPDLVHVHVAYRAGFVALSLKLTYGINYVVTEHWSGYGNGDIPGLTKMRRSQSPVLKRILRSAAMILPVSPVLESDLSRFVPGTVLRSIPNVVNESLFFPPVQRSAGKFRLIHVSTMGPEKRPELLFRLFNEFRNRHDAELVCVGTVPSGLKEWVNNNIRHSADISFTGNIAYSEVPGQMHLAHMLVITSIYETFSCVAVEALLTGLPVVGTPVGILPELINAGNGKIANDFAGLLEAMCFVYRHYHTYDPVAIASAQAGKFSFSTVAKQFRSVYNDLHT